MVDYRMQKKNWALKNPSTHGKKTTIDQGGKER
jgi:hypothetical protein